MPNAQCKDETVKANVAPDIDRCEKIGDRGSAPALPILKSLRGRRVARFQRENILGQDNKFFRFKFLDDLVTQSFDVESQPRGKMLQPLHPLGITNQPARATPYRIHLARRSFLPFRMGTAHRAEHGKHIGHRRCRPLLQNRPDNLRDDIARPLHNHRVANAHIFPGNFIFVVQRGIGHHNTSDCNGPQPCHRRQRTRAPHLNIDTLQNGRGLLRRKLVGHGPARTARHEPQPHLQTKIIDLVNHAINIIAQTAPLAFNPAIMGQ